MTGSNQDSPQNQFAETIHQARPRAISALVRYFRDLDSAEDAFQEACLRALKQWPEKGPPRDAAAWLIFVGRNAGIDEQRKLARQSPLADDMPQADDRAGAEEEMARNLDQRLYRDDFLRLFFICCHPSLSVEQQLPLALRIIAGLSVAQIARAFLVQPRAMEQRITRAKRKIGSLAISYDSPSQAERENRLADVRTILYLIFNEGYSASSGQDHMAPELCLEAIRLTRHLLRLFPEDPESMGLLSLMLLQHSRARARLDRHGAIILLEDQDRGLWDRKLIEEGSDLLVRALQRKQPGPLQIQAAIAATHANAGQAEETDWAEIERLYQALSTLAPSPVITLNHAVAVAKCSGAEEALEMIEPLSACLDRYFHFHAIRGAWLKELGRSQEALTCFEQAISLARTLAEADHIRSHIDQLTKK